MAVSCVTATHSVVHHFAGAPGSEQPMAEMLHDDDGNLYGLAASSGANNDGTLYQVTPAGVLTVLHSFGDLVGDGEAPRGEMAQDESGNPGIVFKISRSGVYTVRHDLHAAGGAQGQGTIFKID
jgi:uncharacterized repeat protein (TIGR03803 family)